MKSIKIEPVSIKDFEKHTPLLEIAQVYDYRIYMKAREFTIQSAFEFLRDVEKTGIKLVFNN